MITRRIPDACQFVLLLSLQLLLVAHNRPSSSSSVWAAESSSPSGVFTIDGGSLQQVQALLTSDEARRATSLRLVNIAHLFVASPSSQSSRQEKDTPSYVNNLAELLWPLVATSTSSSNVDEAQQHESSLVSFALSGMQLREHVLLNNLTGHRRLASSNGSEFNATRYEMALVAYFSRLRLVDLSGNRFEHLDRRHMALFASASLETLSLSGCSIVSLRHDTLHDLTRLVRLDLSNNRLLVVHPLTFAASLRLESLDLGHNKLKALFRPVHVDEANSTQSLQMLASLRLVGNDDIECNCGLAWLRLRRTTSALRIDDEFACRDKHTRQLVPFAEVSEAALDCRQVPGPRLAVDTSDLERTSQFSLFRSLSKQWFAWTVFEDILPTTTPFPFLGDPIAQQHQQQQQRQKHTFHVWHDTEAVFKCSRAANSSRATIVWKTQYGYLSYLDKSLREAVSERDPRLKYDAEDYDDDDDDDDDYDDDDDDEDEEKKSSNYNSFKMFFALNRLSKVHRRFSVVIGNSLVWDDVSRFYVTRDNELVVTSMRQAVAGSFVCMAVDESGRVDSYEYDIRVRTGVNEYFIYSLFVALVAMIVPSIAGSILCCICEYHAYKTYPMTPPCFTTPQTQTPPNFDFNEWMSNAASYLPNINIHDTLEQVSKKLRKGMEKASVTVKSLGLTSTAYIYSMYEQSSQRWSDIKAYVPNLNVPTLSMPTMRYAPVNQLASRMRTGMGNVFHSFCGTSDLQHTASILDLDVHTSSALGTTYITLDQLDMNSLTAAAAVAGASDTHRKESIENYLRFLRLIGKETRLNAHQSASTATHINYGNPNQNSSSVDTAGTPGSTITTVSFHMPNEQQQLPTPDEQTDRPTTSSGSSSATVSFDTNSTINKLMLHKFLAMQHQHQQQQQFIHQQQQQQQQQQSGSASVIQMNGDEDDDSDDDDDDYEGSTSNNSSSNSSNKTSKSASFFRALKPNDDADSENAGKLEPGEAASRKGKGKRSSTRV